MDSLWMDARHTVRKLFRTPGFTIAALLTLAIGIGANTAIFSVVNGVLLKPLPYPNAERLIGIWHTAPGLGHDELNASPSTYFTYLDDGQSFEESGIYQSNSVSVTGLGEPEQIQAQHVSFGILPALGVQPARGRWFTRQDDQPRVQETVILSHGYWQRKFGGDPAILGKTLNINGTPCEVIGVMPEKFRFLDADPAVYLPLRIDRAQVFVGHFSYQALGRLKPGVSMEQASADIARLLPTIIKKYPMPAGLSVQMWENARIGPNLRPLKRDVIGDVGNVLWVLLATVGIVLFIACANVANLLLVKAEARQQELAVRAALGAAWGRIARSLMLESLILAGAGGALGIGLAYGALQLLNTLAPANLPRRTEITMDPFVLAFTFGITLLAGLFFGLIPVAKYAGPKLSAALRAGSRTVSDGRERNYTRNSLVVVQVGLALVLLIGSGLMIRSVQALRDVKPGFTEPERILTLRISTPETQVKEPERVARMYHEMLDRITAIPGVTSAAFANGITMDGSSNNDPIFVEDKPFAEGKIPPIRRFKDHSPGMFRAMGLPLLAGRDFTWTDIHERREVAILSENLAKEYWGSPAAAIGKRIRESPKSPWREVIGVAGTEYDDGAHRAAPAIVYWPILKDKFWGQPLMVRRSIAFAIRSNRTGTPALLDDVRKAIWSVNRDLPIARVRTVKEIYDRSMARTSFTLVMLSIAAGMALLLGLIGIYGVMSYTISRRTREIGIRIALGSSPQKVQVMFVRRGLILAGIGVAAGLAAALPLARWMQTLLYQVSPLDPITYAGVSLILLLAALLAAYVPARRATLIQPVDALRAE